MFRNCENLKEAVLPGSLSRMGDFSFAGCVNLDKLTIPANACVGASAFRDVPGVPFKLQIEAGVLTGYNGPCPLKVAAPEGVKTLGENAFRQCRRLRELALPDSVVFIESGALENCENLTIVSQAPAVIRHARENGIAIKSR